MCDLAEAWPAVGAMDGDLGWVGQHVGAGVVGHGANNVCAGLIAESWLAKPSLGQASRM